jgi:hypothetical protein
MAGGVEVVSAAVWERRGGKRSSVAGQMHGERGEGSGWREREVESQRHTAAEYIRRVTSPLHLTPLG